MSKEEAVEQLKIMLKVRKEQKEIIECAGGTCMNCNPDIKALEKALQLLENSVSKEVIENKIFYKKRKIENLENDRNRKKCLQVEIDILQELLEE